MVILVLSGGGAIPIVGGDDQDDTLPAFDFTAKKAVAVATVADADVAALTASAEQVGAEITPTIDDLYTNAFLDPSNWREGDYEEVFAAFAPDAQPAAQENVETLTLGATAGDVFEDVDAGQGHARVRRAVRPRGQPAHRRRDRPLRRARRSARTGRSSRS